MKKIIAIVLFIAFVLVGASSTQATSGACSSHGGANCSYKSSVGNAICNDGWESSVPYSQMVECSALTRCAKPVTQSCSDNYQAGLFSQAIQNGSAQYTPDLVSGQIQACKNQDAQYHNELNTYNACITKLKNPEIYPSRPKTSTASSYPVNPVLQPVANDARTVCIKWQASHGYVADGLCCSEAKGIIAAFAQEYPQLCSVAVKQQVPSFKPKSTESKAQETNKVNVSESVSKDEDVEAAEKSQEPDNEVLDTVSGGKPKKKNSFILFLKRVMLWKW